MKKPLGELVVILFLMAALLALFTGCARFHSVMIDTREDGTRTESRQTISTFWDSKSSVAKLRASTTDKTQGLTVGGFTSESSATNVTELLTSIGEIIGSAARAAVNR